MEREDGSEDDVQGSCRAVDRRAAGSTFNEMSGEAQLLLMIAGLHVVALVCLTALLLPALRDEGPDGPPDAGSDDGWGNDRLRPKGPGERPRGGLPLPDAIPARVRLRDHRRLPELLPSRERRPAREPAREPARPERAPLHGPAQRPFRTRTGSPRRS
jgi:hypothetical protein